MGILRIDIEVGAFTGPTFVRVSDVMVDTGSELTWVPTEVLRSIGVAPVKSMRFVTAEGSIVTRDVGQGLVRAGGEEAPDFLVFALPGDMRLLGARTLEGLNLRVDLVGRKLVPAGPMPAAAM